MWENSRKWLRHTLHFIKSSPHRGHRYLYFSSPPPPPIEEEEEDEAPPPSFIKSRDFRTPLLLLLPIFVAVCDEMSAIPTPPPPPLLFRSNVFLLLALTMGETEG